MEREITSNIFSGFYESVYCNSSDFYDAEINDKDCLISQLPFNDIYDTSKLEVSYDYENFEEYKRDIGEVFSEKYLEYVKTILPVEITDNKNFLLEKINNVEIYSPMYYNYSTDCATFTIKTNLETLKLIKDYTLKLENANEYIINHFTSCDGFISFISNDIDYWKSLPIEEYEENMLSALFDMLLRLSYKDIVYDIDWTLNEDVSYDIEKSEYITVNVWYNNKTIDIYEFIDDVINKLKSKYPTVVKDYMDSVYDFCFY